MVFVLFEYEEADAEDAGGVVVFVLFEEEKQKPETLVVLWFLSCLKKRRRC